MSRRVDGLLRCASAAGWALVLLATAYSCSGPEQIAPWAPCAASCSALADLDCQEISCADCEQRLELPGAQRCGVELAAFYSCAVALCRQGQHAGFEYACPAELEAFTQCRLGPCGYSACSLSPCRCTRHCADHTIEARCEPAQPPQEATECHCLVDNVPHRTCTLPPSTVCLAERLLSTR